MQYPSQLNPELRLHLDFVEYHDWLAYRRCRYGSDATDLGQGCRPDPFEDFELTPEQMEELRFIATCSEAEMNEVLDRFPVHDETDFGPFGPGAGPVA